MSGATLPAALGIPLALVSAASFAASGFLQHRATHEVPVRPVVHPRLLIDLLGHPLWRRSIALALLGFTLQVLALRYAPLVLVQPLLVTGVLWFVAFAALARRRRPQPGLVAGVALCAAGVSAFVVLARPSASPGARPQPDLWSALPLASGLGATVVACLVLAGLAGRAASRAGGRVAGERWRALPLSLATGVCYGVAASLVRSLSQQYGEGVTGLLQQWQTYALIVVGPAGVLLNQHSYQAGPAGAPALTVITVTDPLVSLAAGLVWLGESIRTGAWDVTGEVGSLVALVVGLVLLARHAAP